VDTHAHLYADQFNQDQDAMMQRAMDNGVTHFFLPNIDEASIEPMFDLEKRYNGQCFAMMGLHPCSVKADYKAVLARMEKQLEKRSYCAVGEIGLDYYWSTEFKEQQIDAFNIQCTWAKNSDVPIVIHARDSLDDIIALVRRAKTDKLRGIFHCFGGTYEQAQQIIELGFLLGIGGVLTFKKANLDVVLSTVDLQHLVLETDAPYLAPKPYRGKRNESAYIPIIAQKLAEVKQTTVDEVARITSNNALQLFGIT
jgi:TatD DNase family protein